MTAFERGEWLELRRSGLGGSDMAAVLGLSRYATPLQVYLDKVGPGTPREDRDEMRWGRLLEPLILDEYARTRGVEVRRNLFVRDAERPWLIGTLDGLSAEGRVVECKAVGYQTAHEWGDEGSDFVPTEYLVQVQHYMGLTGAAFADVVALFGGQRLRVFTVARDEDLLAVLRGRAAEFWARVMDRDPPAPEADDVGVMRIVYPPRDAAVELGDDVARLVDAYREAADRIKAAERERDAHKVAILAALAGATRATLPDGRSLRQTVVETKEHVVKASTGVRMSIQEPRKVKVKA